MRGFDILGLVVDESALETHALRVEHHDIAATFGERAALKPAPERLSELRGLLLSVLESLDANPAALQHRQTQRLLEQSVLSAVVAAVVSE